jgi:alanyl-tRNA synthetase
VRVLSVLPSDLPAAVERLQVDSKGLQKEIKELRSELAGYEGRRLAAAATVVGDVRLVVQSVTGWDAAGLKVLAAAAVATGRVCAALVSTVPPVSVVIARSPGVPVDVHQLLRQIIERFGGRGGGKPDLAQGGGFGAPPEQIAVLARELIEAALRFA